MVGEVGELLAGAGLRRRFVRASASQLPERRAQGLGTLLPDRPPPLGRLAPDLGLDPVELVDPAQRLGRDRRGVLIDARTAASGRAPSERNPPLGVHDGQVLCRAGICPTTAAPAAHLRS